MQPPILLLQQLLYSRIPPMELPSIFLIPYNLQNFIRQSPFSVFFNHVPIGPSLNPPYSQS